MALLVRPVKGAGLRTVHTVRQAGAWANIAGATSNTYIPQDNDVASIIRVIVTATNTSGSVLAASNTVGPVTDTRTLRGVPGSHYPGGFIPGGGYIYFSSIIKPTNVTPPVISGSTVAPALITSTPGTWTG